MNYSFWDTYFYITKLNEAEKNAAKASFVEANGNDEGFQYPKNPLIEKFYEKNIKTIKLFIKHTKIF